MPLMKEDENENNKIRKRNLNLLTKKD